jgi:hypothetical protein
MNASTWISLGAMLVAVGSFVVTLLERRDRKEQAAKMSQRLSRNDRAYLGARQQSAKCGNPDDLYAVSLANAGPAVARHISVRVTRWDDELHIDDTVAREDVKAMQPGGEVNFSLRVPATFRKDSLSLQAAWTDDQGRHEDEQIIDNLRAPDDPPRAAGWS